MDIVLGVSMTPTTVRMVLVEGENADGVTVDHDVFDVASADDSANAAEQVVSAVLGTRESAENGGHHLRSIGVTWSDHTAATALRDALARHGIDDVMLVSEGHAAASLAQAVGRAVGYEKTALLFVDRDTATLSVVQTDDGSVVKVLSRSLHSADAMAVLTELAGAVTAQQSAPQAMFVVGSGVDIASVKAHLEHLVSIPVNAPEDAELALARGAALASASAPAFEATTVGLAYSQDPDGPTAGSVYAAAAADTQLAPATGEPDEVDEVNEYAPTAARAVEDDRKPFLLVGSALTSIFVVGVVALAISLAVSIRPTADQRPSPAQSAIVPSSQVPAPVEEAVQLPPEQPSAETIKPPVPVVQEAPQQAPRTVYVERQPAPAPAAPPPAPAPAAPPPAPAPPPVVAPPVVVPPPVVVAPQPQWPDWQPPRRIWEWPSQRDDDGNDDSELPTRTVEPTRTAEPTRTSAPQPTYTQSPQPTRTQTQAPQVPEVPQQSQWPQWPGSGSRSGSGSGSDSGSGSSGSGSSGSGGRGSGDSGSSRGGSSGVPGDLNGDGCFLVFCAKD